MLSGGTDPLLSSADHSLSRLARALPQVNGHALVN
jgi:hypothetical protein